MPTTQDTPRKRVKDHQVYLTASAAKKAQTLADYITKGDADRLVAKLINAAHREQLEELKAKSAPAKDLTGSKPVRAAKPARKGRPRKAAANGAKGGAAKGAAVGVKKPRRTTRRRAK